MGPLRKARPRPARSSRSGTPEFCSEPRGAAVVVIGASVPLAVPRLLEHRRQPPRLGAAALGEGIVAARRAEGREVEEHGMEEEAEPDALAPSFAAHEVHAVVPIAGAHQRQAVLARRQAAVERAPAVLEERGALGGDARLRIGLQLARR